MLELKDVVKVFYPGTVNEKVALNGLNLKLEEGDFVTVIGGNGAGKSTMLNAICGVWPIDDGKVIIDGKDVIDGEIVNTVPYSERIERGKIAQAALRDYDNLWNYAKELYSIPEYKEFADFEKIKQEELLGTKEENPYQIVGLGPDESYWNEPNNRAEKFA